MLAGTGGFFDPEEFDLERVNKRLRRIGVAVRDGSSQASWYEALNSAPLSICGKSAPYKITNRRGVHCCLIGCRAGSGLPPILRDTLCDI